MFSINFLITHLLCYSLQTIWMMVISWYLIFLQKGTTLKFFIWELTKMPSHSFESTYYGNISFRYVDTLGFYKPKFNVKKRDEIFFVNGNIFYVRSIWYAESFLNEMLLCFSTIPYTSISLPVKRAPWDGENSKNN